MHLVKLTVAAVLIFDVGGTVAMAEVVTVVSAKNPVESLSKNQVMDIFLGKVSHFPNGNQAIPIDQAEGSTSRDEFYADAGKSPAQLKAYWAKIIFTGRGQPPKAVVNDNEVKKRIVENPNMIGYIEKNMIDTSVKLLQMP